MNFQKTALATLICSFCFPSYGAEKVSTSPSSDKTTETITVRAKAHLLRSDLDSLISSTLIEREQLDMMQANSLGETLKLTPGIHANYYGPSASRPIIRGLDGPRVKVLQNGLSGGDASAAAPDHQVSSEVSTATQIEVLRGPATLLHGSGAIGGVVNVIDERVPTALSEEITGEVISAFTSVNDAKDLAFSVKGSTGSVAFYADGFSKDANETHIPNFLEHDDEHEEEEHDEHEEEEHDEHEEEGHDEHEEEGHDEHEDESTRKVIENSQSRSTGFTLGTSYITDNFMFGIAYGETSSKYGLVGHEHEEDEHHDEGEEEGHEEEHDEHEHDDEALPFIEAEQERTQINAAWFNPTKSIDSISLKAAHVDYQLQEIEGEEVATQITNESDEIKLQMNHRFFQGWQGIVGIHLQEDETTPVGEEANSPATETKIRALFATQRHKVGNAEWHLGARIEHVEIEPELDQENALTSVTFSPVSWAAGVDWAINDNNQLLVNLNHSQRALSASELFAFGEHLGTQSFDVGAYFNMDIVNGEATRTATNTFNKLDTEDSSTLDIGWRYSNDNFIFASSVFYSKVDNFSYQAFLPEESDGLDIYQYRQADAKLYGGELQFSYFINDQLTYSTFLDYSNVELTSGEDIPRIPPLRLSNTLNWEHLDWHYNIAVTTYATQNNTGEFETSTDGYTLVDLGVFKHQETSIGELKYFFKINNLFDQEAQVHSSFIKDDAPLPGVSFKAGIRWSF